MIGVRGAAKRWLGAILTVLGIAGSMASVRCDTRSLPIFIKGVDVTGNEPPTLTILRPSSDVSINQGDGLVIEWLDTDRDSDARISFSLVGVDDPSIVIPLVEGIQESQDGGAADRFTASTGFVPLGTFNLRGRIDDGINRPVSALASNRVGGAGAVVVRVVTEGTARQNNPPQVFVRDPGFNLSVSQDDTVTVVVQPTSRDPNVDPNLGPIINDPFDDDSTTSLYVALDLDNNPLNDDVVAADPTKIIRLTETPVELTSTDFAAITFQFPIDLDTVPLRPDGKPYFIRATITDGQNAPVHSYAAGTLNVVRAVSSPVNDLASVGKTTAGVRFVGFNPGSRLGTRMINVRDFDLDGIDDFMLVAQFGNPRNFGNIGEAYLIYGLGKERFGGFINVNSTATAIPGTIFEAPPARRPFRCGGSINVTTPRTDGITDVAYIPDLNGDNRPELLFGCAHVDGVFTTRDDDPGDDPPTGDETLKVQLLVHQGLSELTVQAQPDDLVTDFTYLGMEDVVISSADPNANLRAGDIEWVNAGANNRKWTLIKFKNIISTLPIDDQNRLDRVSNITGELVLRILDPGGPATIHELFRDFDEATTTFASFGEPVAIVDYDEDELGTIDAGVSGAEVRVSIDGNGQLQRLIFGLLAGVNNELRFIIVPSETDDQADNPASAASKEFGTSDSPDRPTLDFEFDRELQGGPLGCYPDNLPNNFADQGNEDAGCNERKFEALGFVSLVHSTNRDAAARLNPDRLSDTFLDRLADTVVSLELVGMRPAFPLESGISAGEQAIGDEANRTEGIRFTAGWYDFYDSLQLGQPPLNGLFGQSVSWMPDVDLDGFPEVVISSPRNERDFLDMLSIPNSTHASAHRHNGSITVIPGTDFDVDFFRDKSGADTGTSCIPWPEDQNVNSNCANPGQCSSPGFARCGPFIESGTWEVFAEHPDDLLGGARSPGDFNLDNVPDLICGAPGNDRTSDLVDSGALYVIYGRSPTGNVRLVDANDPRTRPPMLRVRGETPGDRIGWKQEPVRDVNGDRIDDVLFSSPMVDFIVPTPECVDFTSESVFDANLFNACRNQEVFLDDTCKQFDYNNDRVVDDADREVFDCVQAGGGSECCPVDNGYVGIIFGGVDRQGDRVISQLGTDEFSGVVFYGTHAGDRAGFDISSAGDFDQDGFGDILVSAPGELRVDENGRQRMGVTYLIYGGPHLENQEVPIELSEIGDSIPGMVFLSPYESGAPDEAPTDGVGFVGDINDDGFGDIAISASMADLLDDEFPQGNGSDNDVGRRPDQGDIYIIYGNNINR